MKKKGILLLMVFLFVGVGQNVYAQSEFDSIEEITQDAADSKSFDGEIIPLSEEDYFSSTHNAPCGGKVTVVMRVRIGPDDSISPLSLTATSSGISKKGDYYVYFEPLSYSISQKTKTSCTVTFIGYEWRASLVDPDEWWVSNIGYHYSIEIFYPTL